MKIAMGTKREWDRVFTRWAKPPGKTEQDKSDRALRVISEAVANDSTLSARSVRTFNQGSYRNRTSVRQDSDVDVCILCEDTFFFDPPPGMHLQPPVFGTANYDFRQLAGLPPASYTFDQYKVEVKRALEARFGKLSGPHNKAFDIHENSARVDADAAPCFPYRMYYYGANGQLTFEPGTALIADDTGFRITNFPEQQYNNGVAKNTATGRRFKRAVRIVKKLSNEMEENGYASAKSVPSFLIESLIWNAPDILFSPSSLRDMTVGILGHLWELTEVDARCQHWTEENGIKPLFNPIQAWTRSEANRFLRDAWLYIENG